MSETFQIETKEGLCDVLNQLVNMRVSDIYVTANKPLEIRKVGDVFRTTTVAPSEEVMIDFLNSVGDIKIEGKLSNMEEHPAGEIDGALSMPAENGCPSQRFRYNFFRLLDPGTKRQTVKLALRPLGDKIPAPEELMIPPELVRHIDKQPQGLILVCGKTGAGKSTSLAAMLQHRANKFTEHIVTLEQPIEYILRSDTSSISQREVGVSTESFATGLRAALRQSPNSILVGEIRDRETAEIALSAAESGHLVFGTLHTSNAAQSIERFVNLFLTEARPAVWNVLSTALKVIMCQILVKDTEGHRVAAREILIVTDSISAYIKQQDLPGVRRGIESGFQEHGMFNWERTADELSRQGLITDDTKKEILELGR
jgi:twitching motility protein PilT